MHLNGWEWLGLGVIAMTLIGALAGRRDKQKPAQDCCKGCGWPRSGPLPCLCPESTPGRYEGEE